MPQKVFLQKSDPGAADVPPGDWMFVEYRKMADYFIRYKWAADELFWKTREKDSDRLVLPMLFLYRHYLEMGLKLLDSSLKRYRGESIEGRKVHDLVSLWDSLRRNLEELRAEVSSTGVVLQNGDLGCHVQELDSIIRDFHQVDPSSMAFRYAKDLKGNDSVPDAFYFCGSRLYEGMGTAHSAFEALAGSALWMASKKGRCGVVVRNLLDPKELSEG